MSSNKFLGVVLATALVGSSCGGDGESVDDAGTDARPDGPNGDSGGSCSSDTDCDDGVFCNGSESCQEGACEPAAASACDDGIDCTIDMCDEPARECTHRAPDADGDGHADADCRDSSGSSLGDDCDDSDPGRFPGNSETCDGAGHDEDCNSETIAAPGDGDGDGDGYVSSLCCNDTSGGETSCGDDCDDDRSGVHPGATEVCNDRDDDCDGVVDEETAMVTCYRDMDGDSYALSGAESMEACSCPSGWTATSPTASNVDCDDSDESIHPGATEECDGTDTDCDGVVEDADGDGHVAVGHPCSGGPLPEDDCYDANADAVPGQSEHFTTHRGDGSFDYDCSGEAEPRWSDEASCDQPGGFCSDESSCTLTEGWDTTPPTCGESAQWVVSCACTPSFCEKDGTESRTQQCR